MPTFTWGGTTADWFSVPSGWTGGGVPGTGDVALLPNTGTYELSLLGGETASALSVQLPSLTVFAGTREMPGADPFTLDIAAGATLAASQGVTLGDGTLVLAGTLAGDLIVPNPFAPPPGTTLWVGPTDASYATLDAAGGIIAGSLRVAGRLAVTGGGLAVSDGIVLDSAGRLYLPDAQTLDAIGVSGTGTLDAGALTLGPGAAVAAPLHATSLVNHGTILGSPVLVASTGITNAADGRIELSAGQRMSIYGSLDNAGSIAIGAGATLTLDQAIDLAAPLGLGLLSGAGTLALDGGSATGGTVDLPALSAGLGGLGVSGTIAHSLIIAGAGAGIRGGDAVLDGVTVQGTLALVPIQDVFGARLPTVRDGLTLLGGVLPMVAPGGTIAADGTFAGGSFALGSTGTATLLRTGVSFAIAPDAVFTTAGVLALGTVSGPVVNQGVVDAADAGAELAFDSLANAGTVIVETGATLAVSNLTGSGAVRIAQGGTLRLTGAAASTRVDFMDGSTGVLTGVGAFSVAGFAGNNAIELGTLGGFGASLGLSYSGDASGGRLIFTTPGTASVAGINFVGDYRTAPFTIEHRGSDAFLMLDQPGIPVLLAAPAAFYAAQGNDTVVAGAGADTVSAGLRHVMVWGGTGSLTFLGDHGVSTVVGGAGATSAYGGAGQMTVYGGTGALLAQGGTLGNNLLVGGDGATTLIGAAEGDRLFATGAGTNVLVSASGTEVLSTQLATGASTILANSMGGQIVATGAGTDLVLGDLGTTVYGGAGASTVLGANLVVGGSGIQTVVIPGGTVVGGSGTQIVLAGAGALVVVGTTGSEVVRVGTALTVMLAGDGADLVAVQQGVGGAALIGDFQPGVDFIQLQGYGAGEVAHAVANQSHAGGATMLLLSDGARITFAGMDTVTAGMFA